MKFVSKEQWGANPSKEATEDSHPIGSTLGVTLHWEGPHMGGFRHDQCVAKVRGIEYFHEYGRGWGDVAYTAIVCPHGYVFEGRGAGVRSAANGSTQANEDWYAVCYLGGERDGFTDAGKQGFRDAVAWLRTAGNAGPRVNGHRDHKATACPGDTIYRWLRATDFDTTPTPRPDPEDDMTPEQAQQLDWIFKRLSGVTWPTTREVTARNGERRPARLLDEADGAYLVKQVAIASAHAARAAQDTEQTAEQIADAVLDAIASRLSPEE